jgi:hypothetical protein
VHLQDIVYTHHVQPAVTGCMDIYSSICSSSSSKP